MCAPVRFSGEKTPPTFGPSSWASFAPQKALEAAVQDEAMQFAAWLCALLICWALLQRLHLSSLRKPPGDPGFVLFA